MGEDQQHCVQATAPYDASLKMRSVGTSREPLADMSNLRTTDSTVSKDKLRLAFQPHDRATPTLPQASALAPHRLRTEQEELEGEASVENVFADPWQSRGRQSPLFVPRPLLGADPLSTLAHLRDQQLQVWSCREPRMWSSKLLSLNATDRTDKATPGSRVMRSAPLPLQTFLLSKRSSNKPHEAAVASVSEHMPSMLHYSYTSYLNAMLVSGVSTGRHGHSLELGLRAKVVDWLVAILQQFHLNTNILFLAVDIMDRVLASSATELLASNPNQPTTWRFHQVRLLVTAALVLSIKMDIADDQREFDLKTFCSFTNGNQIDFVDVCAMERKILMWLNFDVAIGRTSWDFLGAFALRTLSAGVSARAQVQVEALRAEKEAEKARAEHVAMQTEQQLAGDATQAMTLAEVNAPPPNLLGCGCGGPLAALVEPEQQFSVAMAMAVGDERALYAFLQSRRHCHAQLLQQQGQDLSQNQGCLATSLTSAGTRHVAATRKDRPTTACSGPGLALRPVWWDMAELLLTLSLVDGQLSTLHPAALAGASLLTALSHCKAPSAALLAAMEDMAPVLTLRIVGCCARPAVHPPAPAMSSHLDPHGMDGDAQGTSNLLHSSAPGALLLCLAARGLERVWRQLHPEEVPETPSTVASSPRMSPSMHGVTAVPAAKTDTAPSNHPGGVRDKFAAVTRNRVAVMAPQAHSFSWIGSIVVRN